jgi:ABC-type transport system involved in cytochrome bd biosynthesis fused ATPase/permease subunit
MLARALVAQPRLLVVDDEMAHFDSEAAARVMDVLFDEGAPWSLVVVSHDPEWLERCDRVIEMPGPPRAPDVPGASSADAAHGDASPSDESESKGAA